MDNKKRSPIDRLLFATFLKGRTSSREILNQRGEISPEENQKIIEETNEIINDDTEHVPYWVAFLMSSTAALYFGGFFTAEHR